MLSIKMQGEALDLPDDFSIEIEDTSPIFNEIGSQSVSATVPTTGKNSKMLNAPHRLDSGVDPNSTLLTAMLVDGSYMRTGLINITESGRREGTTFNIGFDNSTAYAKWISMKLSEIPDLPVYRPRLHEEGDYISDILEDLYRIYISGNPEVDDFAVFPVAVNNESKEEGYGKKTYWEVLNLVGEDSLERPLEQPGEVVRLIDGEITSIKVPRGYMVSPFLRVWRILELIFEALGVDMEENPFLEDPELARLVVLNNVADAICTSQVNYSELMPDCTIEEFMNALWVRFGLVYHVDSERKTVTLKFLKDILKDTDSRVIDTFASDDCKIKYERKQYVKLSAGTSIEGAAPSHERFEDFAKGLDTSKIFIGKDVTKWKNDGSPEQPEWDGDWNDGDVDDYDPDNDPDWGDRDDDRDDYDPDNDPDWGDRDDDRDDYEMYAMTAPAVQSDSAARGIINESFLAREIVTGMWYKLDSHNSSANVVSSGFFNWDPAPDEHDPLELTSDDEFVPIGKVDTWEVGTGYRYREYCPLYLFGARHYHSHIKGSEETDKKGENTPLAFMFAYTFGQKTIGRLMPEDNDGCRITMDDGSKPYLSLLFQFKDGLFANYWREYDEILRHGNRTVEVNLTMDKIGLLGFNPMKVLKLHGIRVLPDSMRYTLPAGRYVGVEAKFRTIMTQGNYDIISEQNIPDISSALKHLVWCLYSETFGPGLNTPEIRNIVCTGYVNSSGYESHGDNDDFWNIVGEGIVFRDVKRYGKIWENDPGLSVPWKQGLKEKRTYKAKLTYDIYETHFMVDGPESESRELSPTPIGEYSVLVDYSVILYSKWVLD